MTNNDERKAPVLRFKGFTDDWEQREFNDIGEFYYGKSAPKWSVSSNASTPCIRYGELYTKFSAKINKIYSYTSIDPKKLKFSTGNELLIPRVGEEPLDFAKHTSWLSLPHVAIGEMITVFVSKQNPLFLANYLRAKYIIKFAKLVEGGNVSNLYFERYKNEHIYVPSLKEQNEISNIVVKIDNLISLQQRKLIIIRIIKKAIIQIIFSNSNWKKIKLGQATKIRGGYAFQSKEFKGKGIPIIKISNILKNGMIGGNYQFIQKENKFNKFKLTNDDILIAMSGATTGKVAVINENRMFYQNQRVGLFSKTNNINYLFLSYLLQTVDFRKNLQRVLITGAQPNISSKDIENFNFRVPKSKLKQKQIGNLLRNIDKLILKQEKIVKYYKDKKKFLLQNMFI